jgi:hypothetical protein
VIAYARLVDERVAGLAVDEQLGDGKIGGEGVDGIVERHRVDDDRRIVRVRLTPAGRELMGEKRAWILDRQRAVYDGLSASERRAATPLMRRFATLIDEL